jgi:hypothetical protein
MQEILYKNYCIVAIGNGSFKIAGYTNTFYSLQAAKDLIDILETGITKANAHCKPLTTQKN